MTAKKYKKTYLTSGSAEKSTSTNDKNIQDKQSIEQLKELISKKLNDPKAAKKAAQIISEMLDKKY